MKESDKTKLFIACLKTARRLMIRLLTTSPFWGNLEEQEATIMSIATSMYNNSLSQINKDPK